MQSPHVLFAGDGALRFARSKGCPEYDPITDRARRALEELRSAKGEAVEQSRPAPAPDPGDTVGAVARDDGGYGAGLFAGSEGAVTATGVGEEIIRAVLAKRVYDQLSEGTSPNVACQEGVGRFPPDIPVGLIAVTPTGFGAASNTRMAWRSGEI